MSFRLKVSENDVVGKDKYVDGKGNTECVAFVCQATGAPAVHLWKRGVKVMSSKANEISRGTAIATFDESGKYPTDARGKHGAIYLYHDSVSITVLDQWNNQGEVKKRPIRLNPNANKRSNNADTFYVIE